MSCLYSFTFINILINRFVNFVFQAIKIFKCFFVMRFRPLFKILAHSCLNKMYHFPVFKLTLLLFPMPQ